MKRDEDGESEDEKMAEGESIREPSTYKTA
jgi:hypothetical protein